MSFADSFVFARSVAAPYVDAAGATQIAGVDQPRFDHAGPLRARGLLVEAGAAMGLGDRVKLRARDWSASATWTVLHDWESVAGVRQDAHYTLTPEAMIDGCLAVLGHHRRIAAIAGYLVNYGGWVWAQGTRWYLPSFVGTAAGAAVATAAGAPLLPK